MAFGDGLPADFDWDLIRDLVAFDKVVRERFPSWAWALDHPELGPIIRKAAGDEEWDSNLFLSQIDASDWATSRTQAQRDWDIFIASENETDVERRIDIATAAMSDLTSQFGLTLTEDEIRELTIQSLRDGWTTDEVNGRMVEIGSTSEGGFGPGSFTASETRVKEVAADFMVAIDDATARSLATKMATGELTQEGLTQYFKAKAMDRYPDGQINALLDQGTNLREYFAPHRMLLGEMLGRTPDQVDLMSSEFTPVMSIRDEAGNVAPMTLGQTEQYARTLDEFWATDQGRAEQFGLGRSLLQHMGAI